MDGAAGAYSARRIERGSHLLGNHKHVTARLRPQLGQRSAVFEGDHQRVTRVDRLYVHKGTAEVVAIDHTRRQPSVQDVTEHKRAKEALRKLKEELEKRERNVSDQNI